MDSNIPRAIYSGNCKCDMFLEEAEPVAADRNAPVSLFVLLGIALFWAMSYLDAHAGGFNSLVYRPNSVKKMEPHPEEPQWFFAGQLAYNQTCMPCHQPNGSGTPGMYPPLTGSEWVNDPDPSRMIRIMLDGLTGPISVKGEQWPGTAVMPAFRASGPTDEQLANISSYVRNAWGNKAPRVREEEVAQVRNATSGRTAPWTEEELLRLPLKQ